MPKAGAELGCDFAGCSGFLSMFGFYLHLMAHGSGWIGPKNVIGWFAVALLVG
jgi:hypothetical protein